MWHLWFNGQWLYVDKYMLDITNRRVNLILTVNESSLSEFGFDPCAERKATYFMFEGKHIYEGFGFVMHIESYYNTGCVWFCIVAATSVN